MVFNIALFKNEKDLNNFASLVGRCRDETCVTNAPGNLARNIITTRKGKGGFYSFALLLKRKLSVLKTFTRRQYRMEVSPV